MVTDRRFEAYTVCPKCGRLDCHWLREPRTEPVPDRVEVSAGGVSLWANIAMQPLVYPPCEPRMKPNPEAQFEVIRICTGCHHEWGQT